MTAAEIIVLPIVRIERPENRRTEQSDLSNVRDIGAVRRAREHALYARRELTSLLPADCEPAE